MMNNINRQGKLFIIDDDEHICMLLKTVTEEYICVETYQTGTEFLAENIQDNDIILLDLMMPDIDGIEVMRSLSKLKTKAALILMSGYDLGVLHSALKLAEEYDLNVITDFIKPINLSDLISTLLTIKNTNKILYSYGQDEGLSNKIFNTDIAQNLQNLKYENKPYINDQNNDISPRLKVKFIPTKNDLQHAIEQHNLVLYFQPQVSMKSKELIGVEALVRWKHQEHGLIFPNDFIPLAEKTGLIAELTQEVIELAIKQSNVWKQQQFNCQISVNISSQNITSLDLPEHLSKLVAINEVDPAMLKLEMTETALMTKLTTSLDILTRLRLKGFQLSIDDFGTGYSSLALLHRIPFTELKIDQSFVMTMVENTESRAIVETCIMLGHSLNMDVIAEGVENKEIWDLLENMGCDNAQGYYLAKPLSAKALEQWVNVFSDIIAV